ncbi:MULTISPECIES: TerB family tellurite resistance protein [unclassified Acidovorax]|uniref:YcjF family protein n=1 Tax=unclassified Acidovorax TaxID=2684926 RepID=UPI002882F633|nr:MULTISPECIES: TerB family tellurite resistance protein [unclassified Acidovorax]
MQPEHTRAVMAISLMAAFADEHKDERERDHLREMAESLSAGSGLDLMKLYQDVLLKRVRLEDATAALDTAELRQLAYEMAVGVCDADGVCNDTEKAFLQKLATALQVPADQAREVVSQADALASAPLRAEPVEAEAWGRAPAAAAAGAAAAVTAVAAAPAAAGAPTINAASVSDAEIDSMILNASILNGALELLPQSLASMAIIPLQTRLVYRVGKVYGYELDKRHITDFLATVGVGLTSQYVEQFGRKLVGGLLGKVMGGMGRAVGSAATGSAFSFASTYALGKVAQRYYAGGRTLSGDALKSSFSRTVDEAKGLQQRYAPQIQDKAKGLDLGKLMRELRA